MSAIALFDGVFQIYQLLILGRVIYSWIDRNPYADNPFKRALWLATDPIMEPLRRVIPPMGGIDFSPIAAYFLVDIVHRILREALFPYGF